MSLVKYMRFNKWCLIIPNITQKLLVYFTDLNFSYLKRKDPNFFFFFLIKFSPKKTNKSKSPPFLLLSQPTPLTSPPNSPLRTLPPPQALSTQAYKLVTTNMVGAPSLSPFQLDPRRPCRMQTATFAQFNHWFVAFWHRLTPAPHTSSPPITHNPCQTIVDNKRERSCLAHVPWRLHEHLEHYNFILRRRMNTHKDLCHQLSPTWKSLIISCSKNPCVRNFSFCRRLKNTHLFLLFFSVFSKYTVFLITKMFFPFLLILLILGTSVIHGGIEAICPGIHAAFDYWPQWSILLKELQLLLLLS